MSKPKFQYKPEVKPIEIAAVVGMIIVMILFSTQIHRTHPLKVVTPMDQAKLDPRTAKMVGAKDPQIVPGKSVGKIQLGETGEGLNQLLGKASLGDAAMCKSWARWEWGNPKHVVEIYESCDPQKEMRKTVQQIRFSGIPFETKNGISPKSTFEQIKSHFSGLETAAAFTAKGSGQKLVILDQVQQGIAFVVDARDGKPDPQGNCHMIIIHLPGKKAIDTYLPPEFDLHPI